MSILWSPLKIWMPKNFTIANFRHPLSKSSSIAKIFSLVPVSSRQCFQGSCSGSLATRLCYDFTLSYIEACTYTIDRDLWPTVGHLVHTIATRGRLLLTTVATELLVYRSAIYSQWKTFKYGLGGRLKCSG